MAKTFHPRILTANRLVEGTSAFLGPEGWSDSIAGALVAVDQTQSEELEALGTRHMAENEVVGPYLVEVALETGMPVPLSRRERIRASGVPTIPFGAETGIRTAA